ncbi:hypothetical protein [Streptomyces sp. Ncost-T10-10d]|nr:hypothetical protein [Streptomyces sp. Ncost-T10-10d]SCF80791.1 hypothetical protein GA0115254_117431 [Streptomyces sp. Ncost-T10-10d]
MRRTGVLSTRIATRAIHGPSSATAMISDVAAPEAATAAACPP